MSGDTSDLLSPVRRKAMTTTVTVPATVNTPVGVDISSFGLPVIHHKVNLDSDYELDRIIPKIRSFYTFGGELDFVPYVWHVGVFNFDIKGLDTKSGINGRVLVEEDLVKRFRIFSSSPRLRFRSNQFIWQPSGCEELDLVRIYDQLKDNYNVICQVGNKVQQFLAFVDSIYDEGVYEGIQKILCEDCYLGEVRDDFGKIWEVFDCRPKAGRFYQFENLIKDCGVYMNYCGSGCLRIKRLGVTVLGIRSHFILHDKDSVYMIIQFGKVCHIVKDSVHIRVDKDSEAYYLIKFKMKK